MNTVSQSRSMNVTYLAIFSKRAALADLFFLFAGRCVARIDLHVWKDYYREDTSETLFLPRRKTIVRVGSWNSVITNRDFSRKHYRVLRRYFSSCNIVNFMLRFFSKGFIILNTELANFSKFNFHLRNLDFFGHKQNLLSNFSEIKKKKGESSLLL